jgi:peptidoglycan/LPS O-acetylase OafA/YrhL
LAKLFFQHFDDTGALKIPNVIEPYWILGFEMLFYGIATAFFAAKRSQNLHFCLIPLIIILTFSGLSGIVLHRDIGFFRVMLLTFFFSGSMFYRMGVSQTIKAERIWLGASVSAIVFAWIGSQFVPNGGRSFPELLAILFAYVSFYFLRSVSTLQFPKWLLFIGKISYSLYLIHAIVGYAVFAVASQLNPWISFVILMVLPIPLSALSYKYIEEPMVEIAKKLVKKQQSA